MKVSAILVNAVVVSAAAICSAATISVDPADAQVTRGSTDPTRNGVNASDYQSRVGEFFGGYASYVAPFLIPTLSSGNQFTSASLSFFLFGKGGTPADADLYGVRVDASPTVLLSDDFVGTAAMPVDTSATLIQSSIINSTTVGQPDGGNGNTGPFTTTSTLGRAALAAYLNSIDVNNSVAGQYVFLRFSPETNNNTGDNYYSLLTANAGEGPAHAALTFTEGAAAAVPEPASISLLGFGGIALLRRSRRRQCL